MTLLALTWLFSLFVLLGTTMFAFYFARSAPRPTQIPRDFTEFVHEALSHLAFHVSRTAEHAKPHASRVTTFVVIVGKWSHGKFVEKVFGKTVQAPGKAASFFLKYIAEHKHERRGSREQKAGLS